MDHPSVKNGVFGAAIAIILYVVLWLVNPKFFLSYGSWLGFVIIIYFMYRAGKEARDMGEGYISFGEVFKYLFLTFAVLTIFTSFFNYILFNFIDTSLIEVQKEIAIDAIQKMADTLGNEDMVEEFNDNLDDSMFEITLWKTLQGWLFGLVIGAIIAAIMGAIMKKKNPAFDEYA